MSKKLVVTVEEVLVSYKIGKITLEEAAFLLERKKI